MESDRSNFSTPNEIGKIKIKEKVSGNFFSSKRVNQYIFRLKTSSMLVILFSALQIFIWSKLDFIDIDPQNTIFVFSSNFILIVINSINLVKFMCIHMLLDKHIISKVLYAFYYMLIAFLINLIQTLFTLFEAYLRYFQGNK